MWALTGARFFIRNKDVIAFGEKQRPKFTAYSENPAKIQSFKEKREMKKIIKSEMFSLRVFSDEIAAVRRMASTKRTSVAALIREWMREKIAEVQNLHAPETTQEK